MGSRAKPVLERVQHALNPRRDETQNYAEQRIKRQPRHRDRRQVAHLKHGPRAEHQESQHGRRCTGQRDGNDRPRPKFKQQQLYRQQHRGNGTAKRRRHAGRRPRGQQRLAFRRRGRHQLPEQRAERATCGDDRPFRSKGTARADGNRGRKRLEERHPRGNAAVIGEDLLHRLRDAVASNGLRTEAGHQAHDQSADHRHDDHPQAQRILRRADFLERPPLIKGHVGEQSDEPHQHEGRDRGRRPQHDRHAADPCHPQIDDRRLGRNLGRLDHRIERGRKRQTPRRRGDRVIYPLHPQCSHTPGNAARNRDVGENKANLRKARALAQTRKQHSILNSDGKLPGADGARPRVGGRAAKASISRACLSIGIGTRGHVE